jgi:hypothetical protein
VHLCAAPACSASVRASNRVGENLHGGGTKARASHTRLMWDPILTTSLPKVGRSTTDLVLSPIQLSHQPEVNNLAIDRLVLARWNTCGEHHSDQEKSVHLDDSTHPVRDRFTDDISSCLTSKPRGSVLLCFILSCHHHSEKCSNPRLWRIRLRHLPADASSTVPSAYSGVTKYHIKIPSNP